ncbi:regulatory protein Cys-3 [Botrytis cinerea]
MTATQIYPSIAPIAESELLYQSQHFDPQSQPSFQQQQQQQHSYLDPALAQHDLRTEYHHAYASISAHSAPPSAPLYAKTLSSPTQSLSPREPNAKRDASTAASARFRQKKKQREKSLEVNVKEQKERIEMMECRIKELEGENGFLKELVMGRIKWKEERENEEGNSEEEKKDKDDGKTE